MKYVWRIGSEIVELMDYLIIMMALFQCKRKTGRYRILWVVFLHIAAWSVWILLKGDHTSDIGVLLFCLIGSTFLILDESVLEKGIHFFAAFVLTGCLDMVITWVMDFLYYVVFNKWTQISADNGWLELLNNTVIFIILLLISSGAKKIRKRQNMRMPKEIIILLSVLMFCYTMIAYYFVVSVRYVENIRLNVTIFCMVILAAVVMTIYIIHYMITYYAKLFYEEQNKEQEKLLTAQAQYLRSIETNHEKIRGMHHDMKRMLGSLAIMMENAQYGEANDYLAKWREELALIKYEKITEVDMVDATLYYEKEEAAKKHIKMVIHSEVEEWNDIDAYKLCTILLNGLSNAIEAAAEVNKDTEKTITLRMVRNQNAFRIMIQNPSNRKAEEIREGITTKPEEGHGYGIRNIREAVVSYQGEMEYLQKGEDIQLEICLFLRG